MRRIERERESAFASKITTKKNLVHSSIFDSDVHLAPHHDQVLNYRHDVFFSYVFCMTTKTQAFFPAVTAKGNTSQFSFHPILFDSSIENLSDFLYIFHIKIIVIAISIEISDFQSMNLRKLVDFFPSSAYHLLECIHTLTMR